MKELFVILLISYSWCAISQDGIYIPKDTIAVNKKNETTPVSYSKINKTVTPSNIQVWIIDGRTAPCPNNTNNVCLRVKRPGISDFEIYDGDIENFNFEFDYIYTIQVKEIVKNTQLKDGESPYRYLYVKTLRKEEINADSPRDNIENTSTKLQSNSSANPNIPKSTINSTSALDKKWYLRKILESDSQNKRVYLEMEDTVIWISINTFKDYFSGQSICNKFEAIFKSDLETTFQVTKFNPGKVSCANQKVEDLIFNQLQLADRFEIVDGRLKLSQQWKYLMEFDPNPFSKTENDMTAKYQTIKSETMPLNNTPVQIKVNNNMPDSTSVSNQLDDLKRQVEELKRMLENKTKSPN